MTIISPFKDTNYDVFGNAYSDSSNEGERYVSIYNKTTTNFKCYIGDDESFNPGYVKILAEGYAAEIPSVGDYNTGSYLYYKLGDEVPSTVVDTQQIVDDLHSECLEFKQEVQAALNQMAAYVVETWHEGTEWCRVYSDGWIEQGGYVESDVGTVTFRTPFTTSTYFFSRSPIGLNGSADAAHAYIGSGLSKEDLRTTTGVTFDTGSYCLGYVWMARGF